MQHFIQNVAWHFFTVKLAFESMGYFFHFLPIKNPANPHMYWVSKRYYIIQHNSYFLLKWKLKLGNFLSILQSRMAAWFVRKQKNFLRNLKKGLKYAVFLPIYIARTIMQHFV